MGRVERARRRATRLTACATKRLRAHPGPAGATLDRGLRAEEGVDIATDHELVPVLILLLAACEQASEELDRADVAGDGLAEEIKVLSVRLHDLLARQDHLTSGT